MITYLILLAIIVNILIGAYTWIGLEEEKNLESVSVVSALLYFFVWPIALPAIHLYFWYVERDKNSKETKELREEAQKEVKKILDNSRKETGVETNKVDIEDDPLAQRINRAYYEDRPEDNPYKDPAEEGEETSLGEIIGSPLWERKRDETRTKKGEYIIEKTSEDNRRARMEKRGFKELKNSD